MKVSLDEIMAARSAAGAWSAATLATWGVPWPPPKGWKEALVAGGAIPGDHLQDQKDTHPASNDHAVVCTVEKNQEEIPQPLKIGKLTNVNAYAQAYALVDLFVRRSALKTVKIERYDVFVNRFVTDGPNEIAISIFNTGALMVVKNNASSPLRSALIAFVDAVGSKPKKTSTNG